MISSPVLAAAAAARAVTEMAHLRVKAVQAARAVMAALASCCTPKRSSSTAPSKPMAPTAQQEALARRATMQAVAVQAVAVVQAAPSCFMPSERCNLAQQAASWRMAAQAVRAVGAVKIISIFSIPAAAARAVRPVQAVESKFSLVLSQAPFLQPQFPAVRVRLARLAAPMPQRAQRAAPFKITQPPSLLRPSPIAPLSSPPPRLPPPPRIRLILTTSKPTIPMAMAWCIRSNKPPPVPPSTPKRARSHGRRAMRMLRQEHAPLKWRSATPQRPPFVQPKAGKSPFKTSMIPPLSKEHRPPKHTSAKP